MSRLTNFIAAAAHKSASDEVTASRSLSNRLGCFVLFPRRRRDTAY